MGNFKKQEHGIRVNLNNLQRDIDLLEQDKTELMRYGYEKEARSVERKLHQLYAMQSDATQHGYGYYDYKVSHKGRTLMISVAVILAIVIFIGYLLVVLQ